MARKRSTAAARAAAEECWEAPRPAVALDSAQQASQAAIEVLASQLSHASFHAAASAQTDNVYIRAYDGIEWGDWKLFHMTAH